MVLRLILNVTNHGCPPGFADAKCSVPALPGELAPLGPPLLHPSRRVGFDDPHAISQGKVGRQASQQMNMIWHDHEIMQLKFTCCYIRSQHVDEKHRISFGLE